jgi:Tfp pilus assembly protein PilF
LQPATAKKGGAGKAGLMTAIDQAMKAGKYSQAKAYLERFTAKERSRGDKLWLDTWIKFGSASARRRSRLRALEKHAKHERAIVAKYFRGRLLLSARRARPRARRCCGR